MPKRATVPGSSWDKRRKTTLPDISAEPEPEPEPLPKTDREGSIMAKPAYAMGHVKAPGADYDPATTLVELFRLHLSYVDRATAMRVLAQVFRQQKARQPEQKTATS
jgi:hypothetical protein